ncbi:Terpene synthase family, metal binding domain [Streptosporangium canum]|uniref:Terpene synthase family, metal binding domain n=1 Tax=Streptosporangium canum TaxID=324952 RepID=A0A1I4B9P2_9ACTN|nr:terpene synthase family protein [Streptosporangium canum]SFK64751.1 Terpene synthase family, metal binding domain [Streptosporangium canum]
MTDPTSLAAWPAATISGTVCAVAGQSQRDMREWAAAYPGLFSAKPFDGALYSTLSLAMAFSGPWFTAEQLRMANKVCLWAFGLDWLVDYVATSQEEVDGIARRCLDVAAGAPSVPGDDLTRLLADIRDELAASPASPVLGPVWREELGRMLEAMLKEWRWKSTKATPTFEEYLANADNLGFCFAFAAHWLHTTGPEDAADLGQVREASRAVQRVIRLLNDLGTYERDLLWGDLNALLLGAGRAEVERLIAELAGRSRELIAPLRSTHPELAGYLERQMDFCAGFYRVADYWGTL